MPLEAVMVCIDNSDFTRNGDYAPTRFECQNDAVNLVCGAKTNQNPENSVGLLTTGGDRIEVLITPTTDLGKIISELAKISVGGPADLLRGIQTAQLALKHRQNKNQKQRIVAFVGSPIMASDKEIETLGKNLKKNNVSLDLVSFGEVDENKAKLEKLLNTVNKNDAGSAESSSHMVEVPVGPKLLSDVLLSSVIVNPDGGGGGGMGGGEGGDFGWGGVNPEEDPDLALALRISMEEERARQQQAEGGAAAPEGGAPAPEGGATPAPAATATGDAAAAPAPPAAPAASMPVATDAAVIEAMGMDDMDEELREALLLSMQEAEPQPMQEDTPAAAETPAAAVPPAEAKAPEAPKDVPMPGTEPAAASSAAPSTAAAAAGGAGAAVDTSWFQDPSFVQELLGSLPGVDINDPKIKEALKEVGGEEGSNKPSGGGASGSGGDAGDSNKDSKDPKSHGYPPK